MPQGAKKKKKNLNKIIVLPVFYFPVDLFSVSV